MDTQKIEGWAVELTLDPDRITFYTDERPEFRSQQYTVTAATLVLGKAFTEDQVREMLREACLTINDRGAVDVRTIINIAERHGLKL